MDEPGLLLAVNGTLMRGLELEHHLHAAGAVFLRESLTAPCYRLWSIDDNYPAMQRATTGGRALAVEVWTVTAAGLATLLEREPAGLCLGRVRLSDGEMVFGVLGEAALCEGKTEITSYGGWRSYRESIPGGTA